MRIPPIDHDQWTDDVRDVLSSFSVTFSEYGLSGDESEKDKLSPILSTVLRSPALAKVYFPFAHYLLRESSLDPRHSRIIILRVAWAWGFELEWAQHSMMAVRDNLLTEAEVQRLAEKAGPTKWSELECALVVAVDQMHSTSNISDEVWKTLSGHLDYKQLTDVTFTIGGYVLAGMYMNVFKIPVTC